MAGQLEPSQLAPLMAQQQSDPLAQLRNIHLPEAISAAPDAPGWWVLGVLMLGLSSYAVFRFVRKWRANQYRREALVALENIGLSYLRHQDPVLYLTEYSDLLKRVALTQYPREQVANLSAERWVLFLDKSGRTHEFSMGSGQVVVDVQYKPVHRYSHTIAQAPAACLIDQTALHKIARSWIKQHQTNGGRT